MNDTPQPTLSLTFNDDGTLPADQLAALPEEARARFTDPDFIARAARLIADHKRQQELKRQAATVRRLAQEQHEIRRPSGLTGRQRKRLRLSVRAAMATARDRLQN